MTRLQPPAFPPGVCLAAALVPALLLAVPASAPAQPASQVLTLPQALAYALDHYPAVREAVERVNAASGDAALARTAYLPRLDATWQANRATANNILGQLLPQAVIPPISGPVLDASPVGGVWGSAAGALMSWEAWDFGTRASSVRQAEAAIARSRQDEALTRLGVQEAVASAFLTVVSARQALTAADADRQRRDVLARAAHVLADNGLRPGAEASRADAERAAAQTRVAQARQALALARIALTRVLGLEGALADAAPSAFIAATPAPSARDAAPAAVDSRHPLLSAHLAAVESSRVREEVLRHTDRPRVLLQSALFARGSGADPDGRFDASGLGLERTNWAAGVQVVFPNLFAAPGLRAKRTAAAAQTRAEQARADEAALRLTAEQASAQALLEAATAIAGNTPIQLAAARQSEAQARARYDAGLAGIVEVAEAQALLAQAEYQDAVARVDVWRAHLARAVGQGSLEPFIARVRAAGGE